MALTPIDVFGANITGMLKLRDLILFSSGSERPVPQKIKGLLNSSNIFIFSSKLKFVEKSKNKSNS